MGEVASTISVTFDKSHLITIGEKLYTESIELIRELVNNAYDADATEVQVSVSDDCIVVLDDGSGMDEKGLKQYFNIGSTEKKRHSRSPKYHRIRIGEFGIGKFASLSACGHFEVTTRKGNFAATVIFDKEEWEKKLDQWHLPVRLEQPDVLKTDGTKVVLSELNKKFSAEDVERRILEGVPVKAEHFSVYLNGKKVVARFVAGQRIPVFEGTEYGPVSGELIVVSNAGSILGGVGIEIKVKGVTIKRDLFGMEINFPQLNLVTGEIHADFLPITSDRTNFILDSLEHKSFLKVMRQVLERVLHDLKYWQKQKEKRKIKRVVNAAVERVKDALRRNKDLAGLLGIPIEDENKLPAEIKPSSPAKNKRKTPAQKRMTAKILGPSAVITKLKLSKGGFSLRIDHFGAESPESYTEGSIIYINLDHPLYIREAKNRERHIVNIARLLTQELALIKNPKNSRQAFDIQSRLLTDSLIDKPT